MSPTAVAEVSGATFTVERDDLQRAALFVNAAAEMRSTIPILSSIRFDAVGELLMLTATNLDVTLRESLRAYDLDGEVRICVSAPTLLRALHVLDSGAITLSVDIDDRLVLAHGASEIRIDGTSASDFPTCTPVPATGGNLIPSATLSRLAAQTKFAIAHEETRFRLNGALLKIQPNEMEMVATDGYRMAISRAGCKFQPVNVEHALISRVALEQLPRLDDSAVRYGRAGDTAIFFATPRRSVMVRQIDINFPNYTEVVPTDNEIVAVVDTRSLRCAVARAAVMASERTMACRFRFGPDAVDIESINTERGVASARSSVESFVGEPVGVGLDAGCVLQFLDAIPAAETVTFRLKDANSAIVAEPSGSDMTYVVMPIRLGIE